MHAVPATYQLVVTSLFRAGWTLGRIVCIFLVWLTIFAIMGVLLWSGEEGKGGGRTLSYPLPSFSVHIRRLAIRT